MRHNIQNKVTGPSIMGGPAKVYLENKIKNSIPEELTTPKTRRRTLGKLYTIGMDKINTDPQTSASSAPYWTDTAQLTNQVLHDTSDDDAEHDSKQNGEHSHLVLLGGPQCRHHLLYGSLQRWVSYRDGGSFRWSHYDGAFGGFKGQAGTVCADNGLAVLSTDSHGAHSGRVGGAGIERREEITRRLSLEYLRENTDTLN